MVCGWVRASWRRGDTVGNLIDAVRRRQLVPDAASPDTGVNVGLLVASAMAPGTFAPSLSARSAFDQGLVTGLSTGLHYLLTLGTQDALQAAAAELARSGFGPRGADPIRRQRALTLAADLAVIPLGVRRFFPSRPGEAMARGWFRQTAWRTGVTGIGGALLIGTQAGLRALDARARAGGRIAPIPVAIPVGLGVAYVVERRRLAAADQPFEAGALESPSTLRSLAIASGVVGGMSAAAYGEHVLADQVGRRLAAVLPGGPVLGSDEGMRWTGPTMSGGPGSLVSWGSLGRQGRRHMLAHVRPHPVSDRPAAMPDLSIETVMGVPARATPVQVYVGLDSAADPRDRVDLALAELERTGAYERSLLMLVSPTGTGYVNYAAVAATQYLSLGDVATVTLQYSKRPSPLSLRMVKAAREQNRLLWLRILERLRDRPGPRPRVVLFGESLGAHTSQDVFLHWGTLGLRALGLDPQALGIDRALWIGTPYGSEWMHEVTSPDRLDVDRDTVAVVNDFAQLEQLGQDRRSRLRYVLVSHDNDGVTKFGPDLLTTAPSWLGPDRPKVESVGGASPRGVPPGLRWRPITTFFQCLVDMKNAQLPGVYRAWAHDYRPDLPRFVSEVYDLSATARQLAGVESALRSRESVRERLFAPPAEVTPG